MYEIHCGNTEYFTSDSWDVWRQLHRHSVLWLLLEAGMCAKKDLSPLQIHSLGMVVIPPIHSNLIWQKVVCMTEPWASIGGGDEGEANDAHAQEVKWVRRRIPSVHTIHLVIKFNPSFWNGSLFNKDIASICCVVYTKYTGWQNARK